MVLQSFDAIFKALEVLPTAPLFYERVSSLLARRDLQPDQNILDIALEEFDDLSKRLDKTQIQESSAVRNVLKARLIAHALVRDDGEIDFEKAHLLLRKLKENLYSLSPGRAPDAIRDEHIVHVLELLVGSKELSRLIKNLSRPVSNRLAEEVIRETLLVAPNVAITDVHVRRAALAAWLTFLRQSLGSCFATAPAILIQTEQPERFLRDLDEMMNTGRMRRTFGGVEYSVPMSTTWGNGDLKKPLVLPKDLQYDENKVWMSPGLMNALDAVHIFKDMGGKEIATKEKIHLLHKLLEKSVHHFEKHDSYIVTSAEEILRVLLLEHHKIHQKDVEEFLGRPKNMIHSGLMMHVPRTSKQTKAKGDPVQAFLRDFEVAKTAFKALADCALLKSWEFTVASFAEIKLEFTRFNLYTSLGVNFDDVGGIGDCLYKIISQKIEQANSYLKEKEEEYEQVAAQMRYLESRARQASTEKEVEWIKVEYQSRQAELYHIEQLRQMAHEKATKISRMHEYLMQQFDKKFCDYFQEIYDADIHDISSGPFDDSPAGFRLLFKHGRSNPSQWTRIHTLSEFVEALVSFFTIVEQELSQTKEIKGAEADFSAIITQLVTHVRSETFLESAFHRMARAHGAPLIAKPLQNLDKIEKKPWVYTSGGSITTLVSAYFKNDEKPFEASRWVETEIELFAFLLDTLKQLPDTVARQYLESSNKSMLMHSPTHAFLLKPGLGQFKEGWQSDEMYTYSWIKHKVIEPVQEFYKTIEIEEEMAHDMAEKLCQKIPHDFRPRFKQLFNNFPYRLSVPHFSEYMMKAFHTDRGLKGPHGPIVSKDILDEIIYSHIPYVAISTAKNNLDQVFSRIFVKNKSALERSRVLLDSFWKTQGEKKYVSSKQLREIASAFCILACGSTKNSQDLRKMIIDEMRKLNLVLPQPVIFADTNWIKDYFAFVVNPTTDKLEFWSVDALGVEGKPVSHWKMWLNGARRDPKWGIFSRPKEYVGQ